MITGRSVHNQSIERLWNDMHHCVTSVYYRLFYYLEHQNYLKLGNNFHCYALHAYNFRCYAFYLPHYQWSSNRKQPVTSPAFYEWGFAASEERANHFALTEE